MNHDVVFIAMENWDEMWRRNQPVAAGFAQRAADKKVLFVGLSIDATYHIRKLKFKQLFSQLFSKQLANPDGFKNIYLLNVVKFLPNTLSIGRAINRLYERWVIRRTMKKLGMSQPLLWINPHYAVHMLGKIGESATIYDVGDDWTSFSQPSEWLRKLVIAEDVELTERADATIVVSERLFEMKKQQSPYLRHIPNGVYVERYTQCCDHTLPVHPIAKEWPKPVLGYTGSIHQDRVNVDLVCELAKAFPQGTIALVGPNMLNPESAAKVAQYPNIKLPGTVHFAEVANLMSGLDVCIVPHQVTDFTESLSPLKLYEYLASGLPTVATPVSGFRDYPELIHLANTPEDFIVACHAALNEPKDQARKRQAIAKTHSWDARLDEIEAVIDATYARRAGSVPSDISAAHAV